MERSIGYELKFSGGQLRKMYFDGKTWSCIGIWNKKLQKFVDPRAVAPMACVA